MVEENVLPLARPAEPSPTAPLFSRAWLESSGFVGFASVSTLQRSREGVPGGPGVYAVVRTSDGPPRFRDLNPGGRFKGRDPTAPVERLRERWRDETPVLYLGKADSLQQRIEALVRFAAGEPLGHWGGRFLWQLDDSDAALVAWREHPEPCALEADLLRDFEAHFGSLPFANILRGRTRRK